MRLWICGRAVGHYACALEPVHVGPCCPSSRSGLMYPRIALILGGLEALGGFLRSLGDAARMVPPGHVRRLSASGGR